MDKFLEFKELAFGSRMKRLSDLLMRDVKKVYKSLYIDFDPTLFPIFKTIGDEQMISIKELTDLLKITQPAVTQFVNKLEQKELISIHVDENDRRKKIISLSEKGIKLTERLKPI